MKKLFTLFLFALLAITSAWAADYSLVTSASDLAAGDVIVIASSSKLMSTKQNNNNRSATTIGVTFSEDKKTVSVTGSNVEVITLEAGTKTGTFAFKVTNGYLYAASSGSNYLRTQTTKDANGSATISINSDDGKATITFQGENTRNLLQYNASNSLFACYDPTNPQQPVYIYKAASSGKTATSLSFGADWDGKKITKYIGEKEFPCPTATLTPAVDGAAITYASDNENVAAIVDGTIMLGDAGLATITASYAGNDTYDASDASFTIDLQKLPAPTFSVTPGSAVVAGTEVTITAPTNCTISYFVNDGAVQYSTTNTVKLTINEETKILACSRYQGAVNTIESEGAKASYTIKTLDAIEITGTPSKTTYAPGEAFDLTGLKVTPKYSDGSTSPAISGATMTFSPATFASGDNSVTVTATYGDLTATKDFDVTVAELIGDTYTLVTSKDELESGAKYVLLTSDGARAASDYSDPKITTVAATDGAFSLTDNVVTVNSDAVNVFNLTGNKTDGWKISDSAGNKFGSSKADINTVDATYTIDFVSEIVSIVDKTTTTREWLLQRYSTSGTSTTPTNVIKNYASSNADQKDYCTLKLYKSNAQVVKKPAAPTFDPASGAAFDTETATVTITAPAGCTLKYTVGSGAEQTSASNTAEVTVSPTAYTITAKSVDAEGVESNEATATYTFNVVAYVKNIAEFLALPDKTTAIFDNPVVVLYDYSQPSTHQNDAGEYSNPEYIWVKDESGQTNLYLEVAIDPTNHQAKYENGDVIPAGFKAVKNYYIDGKFYQALVDTDNKSLLADASHKRLADPVTITFDEFNALQVGSDADIAKWNNTYVMISKVTMAADETDKRGKTYNVSHNGVAATNNVFYNKYSDLRDGKYALTKQGEDARVTMPTSSTIEYNVYGILQRFNEYWEIMPIRFVEYSEATVTLKELVEAGNAGTTTEGTEYTILNDLRGVVALPNNVILAKDENGNAVGKVTPAGKSFVITAKSYFSDDTTESVNAKAQEDYDQSNWVEIVLPTGVSASDYVDKIITGLSVKGQYKNTLNPRLEASVAPTPGGETGAYTRNAMCPANFMGTSQACNSEEHHGDYFFMTPKPNECVQVVWAVYNSTDGNFYIPAKEGSINTHAFKGGFDIDWTYNAGGVIDGLQDGGLYQFKAVVKKQEKAEPQSGKRRIDYYNTELSTDYLVYPLNLDGNYVTGITEAAGAKTVKSVRYFNIMGVELAEPAAGVNIVLTTYTDGTTHSQKILK